VSSLNVSAAGAVVLFEAFRQRRNAAQKQASAFSSARGASKPASRKAWDHEVLDCAGFGAGRDGCRRDAAARDDANDATATGPTQTAPASSTTQAPAAQNQAPTGKVIFSRSTDENGQTQTEISRARFPARPQPSIANAPVADDAERQAETFTGYDMDVRLRVADRHMAVRALVTLRNDGKTPLAHLPLQISSSLNWERFLWVGARLLFR